MDKKNNIKSYILEQVKNATLDPKIAANLLKEITSSDLSENTDIAVVGLEAKFSNANDKTAFWELLINHQQTIRVIPDGRYQDVNKVFPGSKKKDYFEAGYLEEIDKFDNVFFRLSPQEAKLMDPKQRLFLETAYKAMEDAGYTGERIRSSKTGVFVGVDHSGDSKYSYMSTIKEPDFLATVGNSASVLASRIAYIMDLKGPSMVVDTACSSSLVSIYTACTALHNHDCDLAIAGGINIFEMPLNDQMLMDIENKDTKFRVFDKYSTGTAWGEGAGAVVLKPLDKALQDHDQIYAVIKGGAINNDGASNGITAPDQQAQTNLILKAWERANINPSDVSYIETHGTGTMLGDPIEIKGITKAFRKYSKRNQFCGVGTIKPNIGHCVGASGIASFIKVVLAIKNKQIPATINFTTPNPYINFINSPVYIVDKNKSWDNKKIVAGISSFGFSGTNCHIILEGYPKDLVKAYPKDEISGDILALSANSEKSLKKLIQKYYQFLLKNEDISIYDFSYSNNIGRKHWKVKKACWFINRNDLLRQLKNNLEEQSDKKSTHELVQVYETGKKIDWDEHYQGKNVRMISLPTYPFERHRYWYAEKMQDSINDRKVSLIGKEVENYTLLEEKLGQIWAETLGYSSLNVYEDFYNLGGDSILANKLVNQINGRLSYHLSVSDLFSHATISHLAKFLEGRDEVKSEQIERVEKQPFYKVSDAQLDIFLAQESQKFSTAYNLPLVLQLNGKVDISRLEFAINRVIERHESLRSNFYIVNDNVVQIVHDQKQLQLNIQNCERAEIPKLYHDFIRAFDLADDLLIRAKLYHLSDSESMLFLDSHHIVADGLSMAILQKEILSLYEGASLPKLSLQYKDYCYWLVGKTETEEYKDSESYWKEKIEEGRTAASLPFIGEKNADKPFGKVEFTLDKKDYQNIQKTCKKYKTTAFSYFVSALNLVLRKYSGENVFSIGTTLHGRTHVQLESMIGMFVNTLPIINTVDEQASCAELLTQVTETVKKAYEYQNYSYGKMKQLNEDLDGELFEVMIAFQEKNYSAISLREMTVSTITIGNEESKYPLTVYVFPFEDYYRVDVHYQTEKISDKEIEIFISNFKTALQKFALKAEALPSQFSLLTESQDLELSKLSRMISTPSPSTVLERFLYQVENHTNDVALVFENNRVTYQELDFLSNAVAQQLKDSGVEKEDTVALLLAPKAEVIISMFAILKVGAVFLPMDIEAPVKRNLSILEDASVKAVISDNQFELAGKFKGPILSPKNIKGQAYFERSKTLSKDCIYIIYTSGTTGKPKGVEIQNISLLNYVDAIVEEVGKASLKTSILTSKYNFDLGYTSIFVPILTGGKLVIASKEVYTNSKHLSKLVKEESVTYLKMTPSLFSLLDPKDFSEVKSLQLILLGGEELKKKDYVDFCNLCPAVNIYNHYGPTETTIGCVIHKVSDSRNVAESDYSVIGRPIKNMLAFVLNKKGELLPKGLVGELFITGLGVAKGYLHSPELTVKKFHRNPKLSDYSIYATGDLVRWNKESELEFLGRKDTQIKHMGYRINLKEIDSIAEQLSNVKQSVSLYYHHSIISFINYVAFSDNDTRHVDKYLSTHLPVYSLPNQIIQVDAIPLTGNGKIDKEALLSLIPQQVESVETDIVSEKEKLVNEAWRKVFGIDTDFYGKNFFEVGGNSLKAIQLIGKLQEILPSASVQDLYRYPTIKDFTTHASMNNDKDNLRISSRLSGTARLSPIQQWMLDNFEETINHHNLSFTFESITPFDTGKVSKIIDQLIQCHKALKMKYVSKTNRQDSYCLIEDDQPNFIVLEEENPDSDPKITENFLKNLQSSLDIRSGRNVAIGIERSNSGDSMTMVINQMVVDHISWRIIIEEFVNLYIENDQGQSCLPKESNSYLDWIDYLTKLNVDDEIAYWRSVEEEEIQEIVKSPSVSRRVKNNRKIRFILDKESSQLLVDSQKINLHYSVQNIVLTAVITALNEFSGQNRFRITLGNNGRFVADQLLNISRTVGRFASLFPVILTANEKSNFLEKVLTTAKILDSIPNQGIGYGILKYFKKEFDEDIQPKISFNFMGDFDNVSGSGFDISTRSALYDIDQEADWPYYLKFVVLKRNDQILVSIEYNSEIIDDSEVKKISLSIQRQLEDLKHISII